MATIALEAKVNQAEAASLLGVDASTLSRWTAAREGYEKEFSPRALLQLAEQHGIAPGVVATRLLSHLRREHEDPALWRAARVDVNAYLSGYRERRRPKRRLAFAEFVGELGLCLPPKLYEKVRRHLQVNIGEPADLYRVEDEGG